MRALKSVFSVLLATGLWVAGITAAFAQDDPYKDVRTVGIISVFGDQVTQQNYGATRLDYAVAKTGVKWDLDGQILQLLSVALRDRFTVKRVDADANRLLDLVMKKSLLDMRLSPGETDVPKYLQSLPASNEVDAYVVVIPAQNHLYTIYGDYHLEGLGVVRQSNPFSSNVPVTLYASYAVLVVDAKSGKFINWSYGNVSDRRARTGTMASMCDSSIRVKAPSELTDAQKATISDELKFLVFSSFPSALKHVGLPSALDVSGVMPVRPSICTSPY